MLLDDRLTQELKNTQTFLNNEGKLYSRSQLEAFYSTFRSRFGPERLASLDGEVLLDTMHAHGNRESLVYWLEFKDDDELPAIFGSIAGGSALKFGIFRRRETGAWTVGSPQNQREISVDEAVQVARKHRDQLLRGVELLERLPAGASDAEHAVLQENMERLAPDVSNLAWGHKYFSLLFPDRLDDYHSTAYQRFHLVKMLQVPPGEGRYAVAGRFVAVAAELGWHLNNLTRILNHRNKDPYRYWRIGTTEGGTGESYWEAMRDRNYVAVGWSELGDLSWLTPDREGKEKLRALMQEHFPSTPQAVGRKTQEVFDFAVSLRERDLVLASKGERILGVGRIVGGYSHDPQLDFAHLRPVQWLDLGEWRLPTPEGLRTTVFELDRNAANLVEVERRIVGAAPVTRPVGPDVRPQIPRLDGIPGRVQSALDRKGQVILYGPPGTGKTYWATQVARDLAAYARFGVPFDRLSEVQIRTVTGDAGRSEGLVRMCTFHPAYGYEDFLEGYRPISTDRQLAFEKRDGIFKRLCADARERPDQRFYLIIDEINRGDIPRIFGELLTILEKDKRGTAVLLPLSGQPFHVPPNVYVLGTMNTADRSIALLDTALRRRFGFVELMPDSSLLRGAAVEGIPLGLWLDELNRRICANIGRDARNLQIGHAYLLDGGKPIADFGRFARVIQEEIVPLLEEYCYEEFSALARILGSGIVDEAGQRIRHELFDVGRKDDLIQALLAPFSEILTSSQALTSEVGAGAEDDRGEGSEPDVSA